MLKKNISIFFTVLFMATIIAPSIILTVDDTVDVSVFYSITEEENKSVELMYFENTKDSDGILVFENKIHFEYYYKKYSKPHLNIIFPPPEFLS
ncbi:hypothetical protein [Lacinutrix salivirga]